eukprot:4033584-Pyramimonas_sp.AAC.1
MPSRTAPATPSSIQMARGSRVMRMSFARGSECPRGRDQGPGLRGHGCSLACRRRPCRRGAGGSYRWGTGGDAS